MAAALGFEITGDETEAQYNRIRNLVNEELKQYFRPEFLNRLDDIIVFSQLNREEIKQIADIELKRVFDRLVEKDIRLQATDAFKNRLADEGYDPAYGARPLRRAIMRLLEDVLAEKMLSGEIQDGDRAIIDLDDDGQVIISKDNVELRFPELVSTQ